MARAAGNKTLAVSVNAEGQVAYDALLRQGSHKDKVVHADHKALVPKVDRLSKEALAKPSEEDVEESVKETAAALGLVVNNKLAVANPATLPAAPGQAQFIKYTPQQQGAQYASGAGQRIIKMQDMPVDPLEPPKFRHTKVPRGPGSPPVPVMHSPPRPVTKEDQANWKIPPCISNWKNAKGYTIPLDKRLAADGRGLQQSVINDKFAGLSEALFMAEAKAREAITMRAAIQKELLMKDKAKKEAELRELALKARMERGGGLASRMDTGAAAAPGGGYDREDVHMGGGGGGDRVPAGGMSSDDEDLPPPPPRPGYQESREEAEARRKRDEVREERRRERERERRLEAKEAHGAKKSKITRDRERDISEKVALGMAKVNAGEVAYDQRLFNQEQGLGSGFGADDGYTAYDKPLFVDRSAAGGLHRPKAAADDEEGGGEGAIRTDKFKADRGFKGAEVSAGPRSAPVEFERGGPPGGDEADPFGLDAFLSDVKKGAGKGGARGSALDGIGAAGHMSAGAGGSSLDAQAAGGSGRRMEFRQGRA